MVPNIYIYIYIFAELLEKYYTGNNLRLYVKAGYLEADIHSLTCLFRI